MKLSVDEDLSEYIKAFESYFDVEYLDGLECSNELAVEWLSKQSHKLRRQREFRRLNEWTRALFESEFHKKVRPPVHIDFVNPFVGLGVFAKERLKPLTYIGEYAGVIRERRRQRDELNDYVFRYIESRFRAPFLIDAKSKGNFCRFINHSDDPNLLSRPLLLEDSYHVIFYTKREVAKGEQLTYDYGPAFWKKRANPLPL